jgi:very-short-patch-repair endonuclease
LPALRARDALRRQRLDLDALPSEWSVAEDLAERDSERAQVGRRLSEALWTHLIAGAPASQREAAGQLADALSAWETTGRGANAAKELVADALGMFPVWSVTNLAARTNLPLRPGLFDLVIIDEASQCDVPSAIPLLYRAKRAMVIGDRRQLTHITALRPVRQERLAQASGLDDSTLIEFDYRTKSCFALAAQRVGERPLLLDQHFRSHPAIISFSNDRFYDGRLVVCTDASRLLDGAAIRWVDVKGRFVAGPRGRSYMNPEEADAVVAELLREWPLIDELDLTLGVVAPYRAQVDAIRERIRRQHSDLVGRVVVDTVHRFQGDERDVILYSPVVSAGVSEWAWRHAADPNLVNVALTRARRRLVIVGDQATCLRSRGVLADLAQYVHDLELSGFDSPIERRVAEALHAQGITARPGIEVAGYRLDLAVEYGTVHLDIECDGAAFHIDRDRDLARDRVITAAGWTVIRFSGRRIARDLSGCVAEIIDVLTGNGVEPARHLVG